MKSRTSANVSTVWIVVDIQYYMKTIRNGQPAYLQQCDQQDGQQRVAEILHVDGQPVTPESPDSPLCRSFAQSAHQVVDNCR